jgi:hypothetical protein
MATESISVYFEPLGYIAGVQYYHEVLVCSCMPSARPKIYAATDRLEMERTGV